VVGCFVCAASADLTAVGLRDFVNDWHTSETNVGVISGSIAPLRSATRSRGTTYILPAPSCTSAYRGYSVFRVVGLNSSPKPTAMQCPSVVDGIFCARGVPFFTEATGSVHATGDPDDNEPLNGGGPYRWSDGRVVLSYGAGE